MIQAVVLHDTSSSVTWQAMCHMIQAVVSHDTSNSVTWQAMVLHEWCHMTCRSFLISSYSRVLNDITWDHFHSPILIKETSRLNGALWCQPSPLIFNLSECHTCRDVLGDQHVFSWWLGKGSLLDFTNEEAKEWWHGQLDKVHWVQIPHTRGFLWEKTFVNFTFYWQFAGAL